MTYERVAAPAVVAGRRRRPTGIETLWVVAIVARAERGGRRGRMGKERYDAWRLAGQADGLGVGKAGEKSY